MFGAIALKIAQWLTGKGFETLVEGYKAKLAAGNTSERISADLAGRELAVEQRERELNTQVIIAEEGRWWTALPRALICYAFAIYVVKIVIWDKVLAWGSTDPLGGDVQQAFLWLMMMWFGGRSLEKVARILKR